MSSTNISAHSIHHGDVLRCSHPDYEALTIRVTTKDVLHPLISAERVWKHRKTDMKEKRFDWESSSSSSSSSTLLQALGMTHQECVYLEQTTKCPLRQFCMVVLEHYAEAKQHTGYQAWRKALPVAATEEYIRNRYAKEYRRFSSIAEKEHPMTIRAFDYAVLDTGTCQLSEHQLAALNLLELTNTFQWQHVRSDTLHSKRQDDVHAGNLTVTLEHQSAWLTEARSMWDAVYMMLYDFAAKQWSSQLYIRGRSADMLVMHRFDWSTLRPYGYTPQPHDLAHNPAYLDTVHWGFLGHLWQQRRVLFVTNHCTTTPWVSPMTDSPPTRANAYLLQQQFETALVVRDCSAAVRMAYAMFLALPACANTRNNIALVIESILHISTRYIKVHRKTHLLMFLHSVSSQCVHFVFHKRHIHLIFQIIGDVCACKTKAQSIHQEQALWWADNVYRLTGDSDVTAANEAADESCETSDGGSAGKAAKKRRRRSTSPSASAAGRRIANKNKPLPLVWPVTSAPSAAAAAAANSKRSSSKKAGKSTKKVNHVVESAVGQEDDEEDDDEEDEDVESSSILNMNRFTWFCLWQFADSVDATVAQKKLEHSAWNMPVASLHRLLRQWLERSDSMEWITESYQNDIQIERIVSSTASMIYQLNSLDWCIDAIVCPVRLSVHHSTALHALLLHYWSQQQQQKPGSPMKEYFMKYTAQCGKSTAKLSAQWTTWMHAYLYLACHRKRLTLEENPIRSVSLILEDPQAVQCRSQLQCDATDWLVTTLKREGIDPKSHIAPSLANTVIAMKSPFLHHSWLDDVSTDAFEQISTFLCDGYILESIVHENEEDTGGVTSSSSDVHEANPDILWQETILELFLYSSEEIKSEKTHVYRSNHSSRTRLATSECDQDEDEDEKPNHISPPGFMLVRVATASAPHTYITWQMWDECFRQLDSTKIDAFRDQLDVYWETCRGLEALCQTRLNTRIHWALWIQSLISQFIALKRSAKQTHSLFYRPSWNTSHVFWSGTRFNLHIDDSGTDMRLAKTKSEFLTIPMKHLKRSTDTITRCPEELRTAIVDFFRPAACPSHWRRENNVNTVCGNQAIESYSMISAERQTQLSAMPADVLAAAKSIVNEHYQDETDANVIGHTMRLPMITQEILCARDETWWNALADCLLQCVTCKESIATLGVSLYSSLLLLLLANNNDPIRIVLSNSFPSKVMQYRHLEEVQHLLWILHEYDIVIRQSTTSIVTPDALTQQTVRPIRTIPQYTVNKLRFQNALGVSDDADESSTAHLEYTIIQVHLNTSWFRSTHLLYLMQRLSTKYRSAQSKRVLRAYIDTQNALVDAMSEERMSMDIRPRYKIDPDKTVWLDDTSMYWSLDLWREQVRFQDRHVKETAIGEVRYWHEALWKCIEIVQHVLDSNQLQFDLTLYHRTLYRARPVVPYMLNILTSLAASPRILVCKSRLFACMQWEFSVDAPRSIFTAIVSVFHELLDLSSDTRVLSLPACPRRQVQGVDDRFREFSCAKEAMAWTMKECAQIEQDASESTERVLAARERALMLKLKQTHAPSHGTGTNATRQLKSWQHENLRFLLRAFEQHDSQLLCDEMGTGKTISSQISVLATAVPLSKRGPSLIITPAIQTHLNELLHPGLYHKRPRYYVHHPQLKEHIDEHGQRQPLTRLYDATVAEDREALLCYEFILTTYDIVRNEWLDKQGSSLFWLLPWNYLLCDEASQLKQKNARVTRAIASIVRRKILLVTGTPVENSVDNLWSLIGLMRRQPYCNADWIREYGVTRRFEVIHSVMLRRSKKGLIAGNTIRVRIGCALTEIETYLYELFKRSMQQCERKFSRDWVQIIMDSFQCPLFWLSRTRLSNTVRVALLRVLERESLSEQLDMQDGVSSALDLAWFSLHDDEAFHVQPMDGPRIDSFQSILVPWIQHLQGDPSYLSEFNLTRLDSMNTFFKGLKTQAKGSEAYAVFRHWFTECTKLQTLQALLHFLFLGSLSNYHSDDGEGGDNSMQRAFTRRMQLEFASDPQALALITLFFTNWMREREHNWTHDHDLFYLHERNTHSASIHRVTASALLVQAPVVETGASRTKRKKDTYTFKVESALEGSRFLDSTTTLSPVDRIRRVTKLLLHLQWIENGANDQESWTEWMQTQKLRMEHTHEIEWLAFIMQCENGYDALLDSDKEHYDRLVAKAFDNADDVDEEEIDDNDEEENNTRKKKDMRAAYRTLPLLFRESTGFLQFWSQKMCIYTFNDTHVRPLHGNEKALVYCTSKTTLAWLHIILHKWLMKHRISYAVTASNQDENFGYISKNEMHKLTTSSNSWSLAGSNAMKSTECASEATLDKHELVRWSKAGPVGVDMGHDAYQYSHHTRLLLTTHEVSSYAKTFTDGRNQIKYDTNRNTGQGLQADERSSRIGQTLDVYLYDLETVEASGGPTVERLLMKRVHENKQVILNTIEAGSVQVVGPSSAATNRSKALTSEWTDEDLNQLLDTSQWVSAV